VLLTACVGQRCKQSSQLLAGGSSVQAFCALHAGLVPEGYVFSDPSRSHRFVFVDQAAEDIDPAHAWYLG
jgi:hypothetical protein